MKKLFVVLAFLIMTLNADAQSAFKSISATDTSHNPSVAVKLIGSGVTAHSIIWNATGTVSTCSVKLEQSADAVTWSDLISAQTCTSNGSVTGVPGVVNYVRINPTTLTGTGRLSVVYTSSSASGVLQDKVLTDGTLHTGTVSETVLYTYHVNAGTFAANSILHVKLLASNGSSNTASSRVRVRFGGAGGTVMIDPGSTGMSSNTTVKWDAAIRNRNATNAQISTLEVGTINGTIINYGLVTQTFDTTQAFDIVVTCVLGATGDTYQIRALELTLVK